MKRFKLEYVVFKDEKEVDVDHHYLSKESRQDIVDGLGVIEGDLGHVYVLKSITEV